MIVPLTQELLAGAGRAYSLSRQPSHQKICTEGFLAAHAPEYMCASLRNKQENGWELFCRVRESGTMGESGSCMPRRPPGGGGYGRELLTLLYTRRSLRCFIQTAAPGRYMSGLDFGKVEPPARAAGRAGAFEMAYRWTESR